MDDSHHWTEKESRERMPSTLVGLPSQLLDVEDRADSYHRHRCRFFLRCHYRPRGRLARSPTP
jgi:hypothetical protein